MDENALKEALHQRRIALGWSLRKAAENGPVSFSRWQQIEHGEPAPVETLAGMAAALGLSLGFTLEARSLTDEQARVVADVAAYAHLLDERAARSIRAQIAIYADEADRG